MVKPKHVPYFIASGTIMEVVKFNKETGGYVGMKIMTHGDFKSMEKQVGFRYQEYQKGFSQYSLK